jgi:hypothetical protein
MLVLGTAHIRPETDQKLTDLSNDMPTVYYPKTPARHGESYGWIFPISPEIEWPDAISDDLKAIRKLAEREGCTWIMLDQDGDEIDELPTYGW